MQQNSVPTPPAPPAPQVVLRSQLSSPTAVYEAMTARREEIGRQQEHLQDQRNSLSEKLTDPMVRGADRAGLEARVATLDARIATLDKQAAQADAQVADAAAVPGAVAMHEQQMRMINHNDGPPDGAFIIGGLFIVVVMLPISLAFARRIWRKSTGAIAALPGEVMERFSRLEQAVESIAIEVERIGEGQRFMTRVFTDSNSQALGAGAAEPVRVPQREGAPLRSSERTG